MPNEVVETYLNALSEPSGLQPLVGTFIRWTDPQTRAIYFTKDENAIPLLHGIISDPEQQVTQDKESARNELTLIIVPEKNSAGISGFRGQIYRPRVGLENYLKGEEANLKDDSPNYDRDLYYNNMEKQVGLFMVHWEMVNDPKHPLMPSLGYSYLCGLSESYRSGGLQTVALNVLENSGALVFRCLADFSTQAVKTASEIPHHDLTELVVLSKLFTDTLKDLKPEPVETKPPRSRKRVLFNPRP